MRGLGEWNYYADNIKSGKYAHPSDALEDARRRAFPDHLKISIATVSSASSSSAFDAVSSG